MKIIIIEDNPNNMYLARFILEKRGHQVIGATDAQSGIAHIKLELPDVILMDMGLPGMDGFEATRQLQQEKALRHIPIIAFTALAMKGDRDKTQAAGCAGYISKPIDPQSFSDQVESFA